MKRDTSCRQSRYRESVWRVESGVADGAAGESRNVERSEELHPFRGPRKMFFVGWFERGIVCRHSRERGIFLMSNSEFGIRNCLNQQQQGGCFFVILREAKRTRRIADYCADALDMHCALDMLLTQLDRLRNSECGIRNCRSRQAEAASSKARYIMLAFLASTSCHRR